MHALHSDRVIILRAGKNKRSLPGAAGGEAGTCGRRRWWSWRVDATLLFSSFSILPSLCFFFFAFCVSFAFSMFVSLSVFSLSSSSSVRSFSSPVRPCISLLNFPVPGAVVAKDGALELLLKTKYNGLTLCFSLLFFFFQFFSPVSPLFSMFFFLSYLSPPPLRTKMMVINAWGVAGWMKAPSSVFSRFRFCVRLVCLPWFGFSSVLSPFSVAFSGFYKSRGWPLLMCSCLTIVWHERLCFFEKKQGNNSPVIVGLFNVASGR